MADKYVNESNIETVISQVKEYVDDGLSGKQDTLTFDNTPTQDSDNPVKSGGVYSALSTKEDTSNKVTSLNLMSTDDQYPSAKCVYDLVGDLDSILQDLNNGGGV